MQTTPETEVAPEARPNINPAFLTLLQKHRSGEVLDDVAEAMRLVVEAVQLAGKPGKLVLTIHIKPAGAGAALIIGDEIKTTLPKLKKRECIFFADNAGNLFRDNPKTPDLPFRTVEGGITEVETLKKVEGA